MIDFKGVGLLFKDAGSEWLEDKASRLGAALAYYTTFSLAPLLLISVAIGGLIFGRDATQGHILTQIRRLVGEEGGNALETMLTHASNPGQSTLASIIGVVMLLFGAAGLFGQLQDALNTVWEVQPKPGRGIWGFLQDRFLSMSMVLGTAFLLLVSLIFSAALAALGGVFGNWQTSVMGEVINFLVSFGVITLLFAMIYRFLPDAVIGWKDVWFGALVTAILFVVGKQLIGLYLGYSAVGSAYGAAGSLAVLLIWLYYSAQIFLYGAELTKAYASRYGSRIVPAPNAEPVTEGQRAQQGAPRVRAGQQSPVHH